MLFVRARDRAVEKFEETCAIGQTSTSSALKVSLQLLKDHRFKPRSSSLPYHFLPHQITPVSAAVPT